MWNADTPAVAATTITVNGSTQDITENIGESFGATITEIARNASMGKFRVFLNGTEVKPEDAPETVVAGASIELRPYDVAGASA